MGGAKSFILQPGWRGFTIVVGMIILLSITPYVGIVAGICTGVSLVPQLTKVIKEKNAENTSIGMLLCLMAGLTLWAWYGVLKMDYPIIITNGFSLVVNCIILVLRYYYGRRK